MVPGSIGEAKAGDIGGIISRVVGCAIGGHDLFINLLVDPERDMQRIVIVKDYKAFYFFGKGGGVSVCQKRKLGFLSCE